MVCPRSRLFVARYPTVKRVKKILIYFLGSVCSQPELHKTPSNKRKKQNKTLQVRCCDGSVDKALVMQAC